MATRKRNLFDRARGAFSRVSSEPPQLVTILTRDVRVRDNAKALGYALA